MNNSDSKWSGAAKDGLLLSLVTIVVITLQMLTGSTFLNMLLWTIKTVGSLWILIIFMKKSALLRPGESPFGYGFRVCLCSSAVIAVYNLLLYGFLFPNYATEAIESAMQVISTASIPNYDEFSTMMAKVEDNYAQIQCVSTFLWCTFFGLIASAIAGSSISRRKDIFEDGQI